MECAYLYTVLIRGLTLTRFVFGERFYWSTAHKPSMKSFTLLSLPLHYFQCLHLRHKDYKAMIVFRWMY